MAGFMHSIIIIQIMFVRCVSANLPYTSGYCDRVDSLGYFVFKYSDDGGLSWSDERYKICVREMAIDRKMLMLAESVIFGM